MSHSSQFAGVELVGAISTKYDNRNDPRFALAVETAERYQDAGLPLIAIDNSDNHENGASWVSKELTHHGAVVLPAVVGGIATQRQEGVAAAIAHGAERVVGHEPEKTLMVEFAPQIVAGLAQHDVLVIGRTQAAEDSLPPVQQRTERLAGWLLETVHDLPADTLSGGRGFTKTGASHLARYNATKPGMNNWIYLYEVLFAARQHGQSVGGICVDLIHPESMVAEETGNPVFDKKRYDQFVLQLQYLMWEKPVGREQAPIASRVMRLVDGLKGETSNEIFAEQFAELEADMQAKGYRPPARNNV